MLDLYDQVIFKERGETFSDNNRGLTKSITNLIRGSSSLTKSMFTMRKTDRINQKFFKPAPEDHEYAEKLTCSIGAILDNWKTKFYQNPQIKTGFSNLINRFRDMSKTPEKFKTIRDNESQKGNNNPSGTLSPLQLRPMDNSLQNLNDEPIVPEKDQKIAQEFLQRFLLNEEGSSSNQINLLIFFNSLPHYIEGIYYKRAKMFCIKLFQESLVAYKNIEDVNAHEFHDERNRDRVQLVKKQIAQQRSGLKTIKDCLKILESTVEAGAQKMGVRLNDTSEEEFQEEKKLYNAETNF